MAGDREQPAREVLPPHGRWQEAARAAARALEPRFVRRHECVGGRMMTILHRLTSMVRWIARRKRAEQDLNDELQSFLDMAAADEVRDGATASEAQRRAALQLGGLEQTKERVRNGRHGA